MESMKRVLSQQRRVMKRISRRRRRTKINAGTTVEDAAAVNLVIDTAPKSPARNANIANNIANAPLHMTKPGAFGTRIGRGFGPKKFVRRWA